MTPRWQLEADGHRTYFCSARFSGFGKMVQCDLISRHRDDHQYSESLDAPAGDPFRRPHMRIVWPNERWESAMRAVEQYTDARDSDRALRLLRMFR